MRGAASACPDPAAYPNLPPPLCELACGPIWPARAIAAFQARHAELAPSV